MSEVASTERVECKHGFPKYDMRDECMECPEELQAQCKANGTTTSSSGSGEPEKPAKTKEEIETIKKKVRDEVTATEDDLKGYRGCSKIVATIMDTYKNEGIRRKHGYKERKGEAKDEIKAIANLPVNEKKLDLLVDIADFIVFG